MSVEQFPDGSYGNIRIEAGNKPYIASIEGSPDAPKLLSSKFVPGSPYERYIPKDLNFEDFCYRCAILKQPLHTYVHPDRFDFWFNIFMLPLESDKENVGYCIYSQELMRKADVELMTDLSQETAAKVLQTCIKLRGTGDFKRTMIEVVEDIRELCKANYCRILLLDHASRTCTILCEAIAEDAVYSPMAKWMDEGFYDVVLSWESTIAGSSSLIIKDQNDMNVVRERNPVWYEHLQKAGVKSIVLFPLKSGGEIFGYIWGTNFDTANSVHIKETLELTTFFLAAEISNYQLFQRLKVMSSTDMLTGVLNRNEMNNMVDKLCGLPDNRVTDVGIVFADLNGLKQVNDSEGHAAGDLLLKQAADLLKKVFINGDVYRAGGDEFMVMMPRASLEQLAEKTVQLKRLAESYRNVCFAVGYSYESDCRNLRRALKLADERMYEDKKRYYSVFPEKKHR